MTTSIANLTLPKRFEALEREAGQTDADIGRIVQRVDAPAARLETLLRQVQDGGLGRFEVFLGPSGSGKTTFFRTLTRFFQGTAVHGVPANVPLADVASHVRQRNLNPSERQVWVLYDRDNPNVSAEQAASFFESLRVLFREEAGRIVLCWPLTDAAQAAMLSAKAWEIGRDSVVDLSRGVYQFSGPPKSDFVAIADLTTRTLRGQSLEVYGLTSTIVTPLLAESETISEFYSRLEAKSAELNGYYRDLLAEKPIPSVWILVAGDDSRELNLTVATLTQGTEKLVDIDRLIRYLDDPGLDAAYLKQWKARREQMAFLMRFLDVRLFELPPNVALAAVRAFGDEDVRAVLRLRSVSGSTAVAALENAPFYKALVGEDYGRIAYLKATDPQAADEYRRLQARAAKDDKRLNKALAEVIRRALQARHAGAKVEVKAEIQAPDSNLRPDIRVTLPDGRIICLEPTWRATGSAVEGEVAERQNTLTVGHIQKYLLEKVLGYVNDLSL